jgi:hypothetical protein
MSVGTGVTGWVAANYQFAINSDPQPDFGDVRSVFDFCISAPIVQDRAILGVITAYKLGEGFTEDDQKKLADAIKIGRLFLLVGSPRSLSIELSDEHNTRVRSTGH